MEKNGHNGWTNYETWVVALWIDQDHGSYKYWRETAAEARSVAANCPQVADGTWSKKDAGRFQLADWLKEEITDAMPLHEPNVYSDLLNAALDEVNWQEIADHLLADLLEAEERPEPDSVDESPVVIATYTRAQAIEDGVLVDVTETAREAGIKYPTAITAAVWAKYVEVPQGVEAQDEDGRLWDVVWMLRHAISGTSGQEADRLSFRLFVRNDNKSPQPVTLKAVCGPGDDPETVITVMLPDED